AVNPELTILRIGPLDLALECSVDADCYEGQECNGGVCMVPIKPLQLTAKVYRLYEIPIGKLIERVLESNRLNRLNSSAQSIKNLSAQISDKTIQFEDIINNPCNVCGNTEPDPSECDLGQSGADPPPDFGLNYCLPMQCAGDPCLDVEFCGGPCQDWDPEPVICTGEPCLDKRDDAENLKIDIRNLAAVLAAEMEAILPDLTSFKKDNQRLELGIKIIRETIYPINYDNMLEMKQIILELGGDVEIVPFTFLGQTIRGKGDPATFYTDEEQVKELMASGGWPSFPILDTLAGCNECEIDLYFNDFDIPASIKEDLAATYPTIKNTTCPGGIDCWDYIVNWAQANNWNQALILTMWGEESGFDDDGTPCDIGGELCWTLGIVDCPAGRGVPAQLQCFLDIVSNCSGFCGEDNTDFCSFMRCWSGGASCTLSNNPNFWPNFFPLYISLFPDLGEQEAEENPAYPTGSCTTTAPGGGGPLPPELAGCPLQPGFGFTCGWEGYPGHHGIDLSAARGDPVYAVADGTITAYHPFGSCGIAIRLFTEFGEFRYCHLLDTCGENICLANEASIGILKGDLIGHVDDTGFSEGDHLHMGYFPDTVNPYPAECVQLECVDAAPDWTAGICGPDRRDDPALCW
ncbi:MAG TPA: M23 family metallopeptidase, partial [Candidatus Nealsonbacteria bacterium]|nr:M23 family metallopeptidase [Candidatus Nealsonbacteria bacterium]